MSIEAFARTGAISILVMTALAIAAILLGGPKRPQPLSHIAESIDGIDWSGLPAQASLAMRDGTDLAYRNYGTGDRIVIALHGSGGAGAALHPLARAISAEGYRVIVPDIRGHGATGQRGDVDYIGQPEDDLTDLIAHLAAQNPNARIDLVGFSMGGGLALRFASAKPQSIERLFLLSPYLAHDAPPNSVETPYRRAEVWASAGVPRIIALSIINRLGISTFNHLPVVAFATRPEDADKVTATASYRLLTSVNPADWRADLAALMMPLSIIVGEADELHAAAAFAGAVLPLKPEATIVTVPGIDHMGVSLSPPAHAALLSALEG